MHEVKTVADLLLRSPSSGSDSTAVADPEHRWTYRDLAEHAWTVARGLMALGVRKGDHVGLLMPNVLEFAAAWFGVAFAGAAIVPINIRYRPHELRYVIDHADLRCVLTSDVGSNHTDLPALIRDALALESEGNVEDLPQVVNLGGAATGAIDRAEFERLSDSVGADGARKRQESVQAEDLGALVFTSGTTSRAKACMHTQAATVHNWMAAAARLRLDVGDVVWDPLPLCHGTAFGIMMSTLGTGGAFLTQRYADGGVALDLIEAHGATFLYPGFVAVTRRLLEHERFSTTDLSAVRAVLAIAPPDVWDQTQGAFGRAAQLSAYGLQEAGGVIAYTELDAPHAIRRDTCGVPFPGIEVRVAEPGGGEELGPGQYGEILVRSPGSFHAYYKDPVGTERMLDAEGYIHTGDLGALDTGGRLLFRGRIKNMLKVGGENVAPSEIESVLLTHEAIAQAAVVGIPDDELDEVPAAFVELRPGMEITAEEILAHCGSRLARFKVPRFVRTVKEWPMSATKIQTAKLRERLLEELEAERTV